jgi:glycosyltransferase involved in cell wall biosynthesis
MRILITSCTYAPALNGQAIFTVGLAEGLAKRGHEVKVITGSDSSGPYAGLQKGVRMERLWSVNLTSFHPDSYYPFFYARRVHNIFEEFRPEIVHIQDRFPLSVRIFHEARRRGIKIIGTNHFMPENLAPYIPLLSMAKPLYNRIMWNWMLAIYNHLDLVTTQSRAAAELVRSKGLDVPVFPVSCGIDLNRFHPIPSIDRLACRARYGLDPNRKIFLFVGRLDREKRVDVLLHALKRSGRDDIQLVVAGRGAAQGAYESLANSLGLGERVRFTGFIPNEDLHNLLNSVDVFSMPSEAELLSIASLEALACGRPVLLADAVALPELVTQGVNGYLFKPGDPTDAARFMSLLADHPEQWQAMGRASVEKARTHSLESTILRYETLYGALLKGVLPEPSLILNQIAQ